MYDTPDWNNMFMNSNVYNPNGANSLMIQQAGQSPTNGTNVTGGGSVTRNPNAPVVIRGAQGPAGSGSLVGQTGISATSAPQYTQGSPVGNPAITNSDTNTRSVPSGPYAGAGNITRNPYQINPLYYRTFG